MRKKQLLLPKLSDILLLLVFLKIVTVLGQTTCNNGLGRVLYERLPNQQLQGFDDDVVRDSAPPFRVLEKCQDLCLRDRTASNNLVRSCTSFDFQPGSRIASFSGNADYEESTCYLTPEKPSPEGIGILMLVPNSVHFTEICLTSSRPERECPSRRYVFERHPRKKLKLPVSDIKEITAVNRSDCEDKCLNEFSFVCRSANFDSNLKRCALSRFTRRTHPELLEDDPNSDYLENTCLNAERRCDGLAVYVKEENKRLGGPFEVDIFNNMTLEECQTMCIRAEKYFCRSVEFDDQTKQCVLSEEDSISQKDDISISSSPTHHFYDLVCLDNQRGTEYPDNSVTSHLFSSGRRPDTAFQRYRNSRLGGEFHSEITGRSLSECLDECLRQTSFQCRSAVYSDRFRTCRLSRYNQRDGMRIIYDADYDYYENLMHNIVGGDGDSDRDRPNTRPDQMGGPSGTDWRPPYSGDRDNNRDRDRFPDRYPPSDGKMPYDKYPVGTQPDYGDRNPSMTGDRYPMGGNDNRFPIGGGVGDNRYPMGGPVDRYPVGGGVGDNRYPMGGPVDRYPVGGGVGDNRYPMGGPVDRYPVGGGGGGAGDDRLHSGGMGGNRYPGGIDGGVGVGGVGGGGRYPIDDRYPPVSDNRIPDDMLRPDNRYPVNDRDMDRGRYPAGYPNRGGPVGAGDRPPNRYPSEENEYYPGSKYPSSDMRNPNNRYPPDRVNEMYPGSRYPSDGRYPDRDGIRDPYGRYPMDNQYPMGGVGGGRRPISGGVGGRYPPEEYYPGDDRYMQRYPNERDRDRMPPIGDSRYPASNGRYPPMDARYPPVNDGRYPPMDARYPPVIDGRYPPASDGRYPPASDGRYPPASDGRYPVMSMRYPPNNNDRYPPTDARYPPTDARYPPTGDVRYPPDRQIPGGRLPPSINGRYPTNDIGGPSRYPNDNRYPIPETRYPSGNPQYPVNNRYPTSDNRFPVGNDRNPINIYKYGNNNINNRERFPSGSGYDRFPPSYMDRDRGYADRTYGTNYAGREPAYGGYNDRDYDRVGSGGIGVGGGGGGGMYDRDYQRGYGRPPVISNGQYPTYDNPLRPAISGGYDNSINSQSGDGFGGYGPIRPINSRCEDNDNFKQMGSRNRVRQPYVRRAILAPSLIHCQRECVEARDFICRSFNYRDVTLSSYDTDTSRERDASNCELSDRDTRELDMNNPQMFDTGQYDYYERSSNGRNGNDNGECLDVSQTCNEDGMEFTLRTPEGFLGRIYTYGFYDRCFFRGNGGTVNVLRISGVQGYPECGTQRYGDTMTNIVVVQFSDNVQTGRDKRFNLTCIFRGPGEAVVTSGYIGAGFNDVDRSGSPIPIEYLPAENTLSSKVRLMILYQNRPTTTIAVGDPLTFRLEAQDGYNQISDIFATNVVARDPYSGRSIQLIDRYGCPVDPYVFPELDKLRSGDTLEARFNAFKIPESNFLVFEATVRSCREGCQPAYCPGASGRSEPSFGRRKRSINGTLTADATEYLSDNVSEINLDLMNENSTVTINSTDKSNLTNTKFYDDEQEINNEFPEHVREMIEVFESREEMENDLIPRKLISTPIETICLTPSEYHGLISAVVLLMILLFSITLVSGLAYRRYWGIMLKNRSLDRSSPINSFSPSAIHQNMHLSANQFNASTQHNGSSSSNSGAQQSQTIGKSGLNLFNAGLQKTFATGNLSRMCQMPVINPMRNQGNTNEFDDPSEPIYTDPSLFERSRSLRSLSIARSKDV